MKRHSRRREPTLEEINLALLSMFAMVDDVFTEHDALSAAKRRMSLGRIYEEWKRCRVVLDVEFDPKRHDKMIRFGAKKKRVAIRTGLSI